MQLLTYWKKNLEESLLRDLTDSQLKSVCLISREEFQQGRIKQADFLESIRTERKKYLLCSRLFQQRNHQDEEHNLPFLILPVEISHDGKIYPTGERPFIPRRYLHPNEQSEITISSIQDVKRYWYQHPFPEQLSWENLLQITNDFWQQVIGKTVQLRQARFVDHVSVLEHRGDEKQDGTLKNIQYFYEGLLWKKSKTKKLLGPLAKRMLTMGTPPDQFTLPNAHNYRLEQWGQMNPAHGLTSSQRDAVHHFLALDEGECLAIEGPPGTGKTTLLQSVIASQWTNDALAEKEHAPVILASSMTNLAIRNILDMFQVQSKLARISFPDHSLFDRVAKLDVPWIKGVKRLGTFCVSQSRQNNFQNYQLMMRPQANHPQFQSNWLNLQEIDLKQLTEMEIYFLQQCEEYLGQKVIDVSHAKILLHRRLQHVTTQGRQPLQHILNQIELNKNKKETLEKYQVSSLEEGIEHLKTLKAIAKQNLIQIQQVREEWYQYQGGFSSGFLYGLIRLPWIGNFFARRRAEGNRYFMERRLPELTFPNTTDTAIDKRLPELEAHAIQRLSQIQTEYKQVKRLIRRLKEQEKTQKEKRTEWDKLGFPRDLDALDTYLDRTHRVVAFWLATHYWEARYLLTIRKRLEHEEENHQGVKAFFRELAVVSPCIVTTMHSAPRFFQDGEPLHNFADLLIIDEASQALPEIAFPVFTLAKKALIVGDTKQLPPISSLDRKQEEQNLDQAGLGKWLAQIEEQGISASQGSVMKWANRLTRYVDKKGNPFLLREHFRCQPPLASYFNREFYENQLVIQTGNRNDFHLPALAYVQINGIEEPLGNSRINHYEAASIALWVKRFLKKHKLYNKQQALKTIAVLTPFKAQAKVIEDYLKKLNIHDMLIVGTIHALQGMEKEVILFSPTYTSLENQTYFYDRDAYILNVAVSRARQSFLIFGGMNCFGIQEGKASAKLKKACIDATNQLCIPSEEKIEHFLESCRPKMNGIHIFAEESIVNLGDMKNVVLQNK